MRCPELFILRHGETEWNVAGRLQGRSDSALTGKGRAQAAAQGQILRHAGIDHLRVISSSSQRCLTTAAIALPDRAIDQDPRLMEVDLGSWTGHLITEIEAANPHVAAEEDPHLWKFTAPGGETLENMVERCRAVLAGLESPTILITHGITSRVLRCLLLGLAPHRLTELPGGQGVVHHVKDRTAQVLS